MKQLQDVPTYSTKVFSIGAQNENHGKALPVNIDDFIAKYLAVNISQDVGYDYVGHLPYCGDREGKNARDWNPGVMEREVVFNGIVYDLKNYLKNQRALGLTKPTCIVLISGHGGNNYLLEEQRKIKNLIKIPFLYIPPFSKINIQNKKYGKIVITHADHAEHSVAHYLGLLNTKNLQKINEIAKKDPIVALKKDPAIMGLGGYVLPELGGEKYHLLRVRHPELVKMAKKFIFQDKKIIADKKIGELLILSAIKEAKKTIVSFLKENNSRKG